MKGVHSPNSQQQNSTTKRAEVTYREEREEHPGGDHDPALPRLHLILRTSCSTASPWFPFLRLHLQCKDTALGRVTGFQVKQD